MAMTWDEYKGQINWDNSDALNGFRALAAKLGYSGPLQERTGRQVATTGWDEATGDWRKEDEWAPTAGLNAALGGFRFDNTQDAKRNRVTQVYNADGSLWDSARTASAGGSAMKAAGIIIPALVGAGFGVGALGLLGSGGAAAAGAGEAAALGGEALASAPSMFSPGATFLGETVGAAPAWSTSLAGGIAPAEVGSGLLGGGSFLGESISPALSMSGGGSTSFFDPGSSFLGETVQAPQPMAQNPLSPWDVQPASPLDASFMPDAGMPSLSPELTPGGAPAAPAGPASPASPSPLDAIKGGAGSVADWMKTNPALGKLLMSGAMGLLSSGGGSSGGGTQAQKTYGPAVQWNSQPSGGLLAQPQQFKPPTLNQPAGLLAAGQANDGAWRYLKG